MFSKNSKTNNKEASKPKATKLGQTLEGFGEVYKCTLRGFSTFFCFLKLFCGWFPEVIFSSSNVTGYCICFAGKVAGIQKYGKGVCFLKVGFFQKRWKEASFLEHSSYSSTVVCIFINQHDFEILIFEKNLFPFWSLPFKAPRLSLLNKVAITLEGTLNWVVFLRHIVFLA